MDGQGISGNWTTRFPNIFGTPAGTPVATANSGMWIDSNGVLRNANGTVWTGGAGGGNTNSGGNPAITVTSAGATSNNTVLDKSLNAILSGLAILRGANKIPTTLDPVNPYAQGGALFTSGVDTANIRSTGTFSGDVETWIGNNKTVVVIGALVVGVLFLPPLVSPKKR